MAVAGIMSSPDLGTRYFQNLKFEAKYLFLYSRQQPSTLQPKNYKLKQESLASRKFKQKFYVSIILKQEKRESSDCIEQTTQNISSFNSTSWLDIK